MDGSRKKQKALPMRVLRKMMELSTTKWEEATSWLLIGAAFFAMQSCEYMKTTRVEGSKRTKILRMRNIQFMKDGKRVHHNSPELASSDIVIITFEFQKNDKRDVQIHMFRTNDKVLNPVLAWAKTIQRLLSYPGSNDDTTVCTFWEKGGSLNEINAPHVRSRLRAIVDIIGEDELGFGKDDIGLHSIRSGGAMAMFLSGISTIVIQRIGRWSSEAFLEYIREQVEDFTAGVAQRMLEYESFSNLQNKPPKEEKVWNNNDKEDGPQSVPFTVGFTRIALEGEKRVNKGRYRR